MNEIVEHNDIFEFNDSYLRLDIIRRVIEINYLLQLAGGNVNVNSNIAIIKINDVINNDGIRLEYERIVSELIQLKDKILKLKD